MARTETFHTTNPLLARYCREARADGGIVDLAIPAPGGSRAFRGVVTAVEERPVPPGHDVQWDVTIQPEERP